MKNARTKSALRLSASAAALALSSVLLAGAAGAEDLVANDQTTNVPRDDGTVAGAAIYQTTTFAGDFGKVELNRNTADGGPQYEAYGGAAEIYSEDETVEQDLNVTAAATITISDNSALGKNDAQGGAIFAENAALDGATITMNGNFARTDGNGAGKKRAGGGAISAGNNVSLTGATISMNGNSAQIVGNGAGVNVAYGGAISANEVSLTGTTITMSGNRAQTARNASGGSSASGGAIDATGAVMITAENGSITFRGNSAVTAGAENWAAGGAIYSISGDVTLTAQNGTITFDGNSVLNADGAAVGGAIYTPLGSAALEAGRIEFLTETDSVFAAGSFTVAGSLYAAPRLSFIAQGEMKVSGALELDGAEYAEGEKKLSELELPVFASPVVDLGDAELHLVGDLPAQAGERRVDFAVVAASSSSGDSAIVLPQIDRYRAGAITSTDVTALDRVDFKGVELDEECAGFLDLLDIKKKLTLNYAVKELTWKPGSETWAAADGKKRWTDAGGADDDFYLNDLVTFPENGELDELETVTLEGDIVAGRMNVEEGGMYAFAGGDSLTLGELNVSGVVEFAREVTARTSVLAGGAMLLSAPLNSPGSFTQKAGTYLVIDMEKLTQPALNGRGTGTLTIESGARLELLNEEPGRSYTVASGFKTIESVWAFGDVLGESTGEVYQVEIDGGSVTVSSTGYYSVFPLIPSGAAALTRAANFGALAQERALGLTGPTETPAPAALGFMPMEPGKAGGVWASPWYSHTRYDTDSADTKVKRWGVTIGADRSLKSGTIAGLAVDLGKSEARGQGVCSGADSDGKHLGLSLYGARDFGRVTLTGDAGYTWRRDDYDTYTGLYFRGRDAKSSVFTAGLTAWFNLDRGSPVQIRPFVGVRYSHLRTDDIELALNGAPFITGRGESVSQWTVPVGVKFDWAPVTTKRGWKIRPSVELAYVYAGGDIVQNARWTRVGDVVAEGSEIMSDRDNFRASIGLDAKRKDFTLGLGVKALLSSGQKDVSVNASFRWDL
ncbi:MAG: autotransporter outer membrane beta-barrel domain-containing protein [Pyramidobacter sp.]|nr:autotransporter outer membrane beta-barrel domain-containing protein [Pyramidobacter sp.]